MGSQLSIGGQAVIEGVMMRSSDKYAIAVRKPNKKISVKIIKLKNAKTPLYNFPIIRGVIRFAETIVIGIKSISYSANESSGQDDKLSSKELYLTVLLSLFFTVGLFYTLPLIIARYVTLSGGALFSLIDGIIRLGIFLSYLLLISLLPDVKRLFQYHGAEHKTVYCYEKGEKLTVENIKKYSTLHPRCGTNFILIVFVVSILFFSVIPAKAFLSRLILRILLLPLIAGVSYEFLRFAGKNFDNVLVKIMVFPGLMLQRITTKEPDDHMIEVAIKALKEAVS